MRRLIITADDFGLCVPVNEAVERAHTKGVLTCASLMVSGAAAADAIERARRLPDLRVGLHLVLVEGRPISPPEAVPALVDRNGEFLRNLTLAGIQFFFLPTARRQLALEIRAQFESFRRTGFTLDHVTAHNHMHLHPTVLDLVLRIGSDYGVRAMRIPSEAGGDGLLTPWIGLLRRQIRRHAILGNDRVLGLRDSGALTTARAVELLAGLPDGVTEMYFHPATRRCPEIDRDMPGYRHEEELAALVSKELRDAIRASGAELISYQDVSM